MSRKVVQATVYDEGNLRAARVILSDPRRYEGLMLAWATLWMERYRERREQTRTTLFEMEAEDAA